MFSATWFEDNAADGGLILPELVGGGGGGLHCDASVLTFCAMVEVAGVNCGNAMVCEKVKVFLAFVFGYRHMAILFFDVRNKERMMAEDHFYCIFPASSRVAFSHSYCSSSRGSLCLIRLEFMPMMQNLPCM